jgi:hypothetical protein
MRSPKDRESLIGGYRWRRSGPVTGRLALPNMLIKQSIWRRNSSQPPKQTTAN